jgi:class 3 adenylate cyclase
LTSLLTIQSKLLAMLLLTSILSSAVVGVIGYQSGRSSLRAAAFDRLTEIRQSQSRQLEAEIQDLKDSLVVYSRGATAMQAVHDFTAGFDQLATATVSPAQQQSLVDYYTKRFAVDKKAQTGEKVNVAASLPTSPAQRYLQALYTAPFGDYGQSEEDWETAIDFDDAQDGSAWSAANARYNDFFREMVTRFKFEDALLLDTRGNVVYSAYKGVDLGTNILDGPYKGSDLNGAYRLAVDSDVADYVGVTDFGDYRPATEPTAWFVSPIGQPGHIDGVLALQFPASKIDALMTMDGRWQESGMGMTGETFIVGPDGLMRSNSRLFLQDPRTYEEDVINAGTPPDIAEDALRQHGTTLVQPVATDSAKMAQEGQRGTLIGDDYLGRETLQAYGPVDIPGLRWGVVAKIDTAEAFAPVSEFTRNLVMSTTAIVFVVCIATMLWSRWFVRPIRRLEDGARQISSGEYGTTVPVVSRDEFGDLTAAFNDMSRNLAIKEGLLAEQRRENDRIMLSLMPEKMVARYRDGEETIAQDHLGVTVIYAEMVGLDELSEDLTSEESLSILNELVRQFDAAAESLGVERIRHLRNGYVAGCGLNVPRIDNVRRTVDFAIEMQRIVDRFNSEAVQSLQLRVGVDTGPVSSGLIGRESPTYDMWGEAVELAYHLLSESLQPGIYVTADVYAAMRTSRDLTPAGEVTVDGEIHGVWRLSTAQS